MTGAASGLLGELAVAKLSRVVGEATARKTLAEILRACSLTGIDSPEDLLVVSRTLEARPGITRFIAQSLRTEAIVLGAEPRPGGAG